MIKTLMLMMFRGVLRVTLGLYRTPRLPTPCIVVSNHNTMLDVYVLSMLFRRRALPRVRCAAAADAFSGGLFGWFCGLTLNPILVNRQPHSRDPLVDVRESIRRGESLILFPEGTRGEPGVIEPFKAGIGEIARSFPEIPVYPCFIAGIERVWPRGTWLPLPFNVEVLVDEPYHTDASLHRREIAAQLEARVRALSDRYEEVRRSVAG